MILWLKENEFTEDAGCREVYMDCREMLLTHALPLSHASEFIASVATGEEENNAALYSTPFARVNWHIDRNSFSGNPWIKNVNCAFRIECLILLIVQFRFANENDLEMLLPKPCRP
jgi:hypothetical protein